MRHDLVRGAGADQKTAGVAAFGTEIEDPVGIADDVEVVLDDDKRVSGGEQFAKRAQQFRDIVEMQAGGRFVEEKQLGGFGGRFARAGFGKVAGEFQALRLAAGECGHGLAEAQVLESDLRKRREALDHGGHVGKEMCRFAHCHVEHFGDGFLDATAVCAAPAHGYFEHFRPVALAVAVRTAQVDIRQELHLDVLEAVAAAGRAASVAGVETEGAGAVTAFTRKRRARKQRADRVPGADIAGRVRARGLADR